MRTSWPSASASAAPTHLPVDRLCSARLCGHGLDPGRPELVHRIEDDPDQVAAGLAETLAAAGPTGGLLDRLHAERRTNRAAFDQALHVEAG